MDPLLVKWFDFCNWFKCVFLCCFIPLEILSRLWGNRRLCGAAGRNWIGPFQDDTFSWSLLPLSWPGWGISLIIMYVLIKIKKKIIYPPIFSTLEGEFHQKNLQLFTLSQYEDLRLCITSASLPKYLTSGEKPMKQ